MESARLRTALFEESENQPAPPKPCALCSSKNCKTSSSCKRRQRRAREVRLIKAALAFNNGKLDLWGFYQICREYEGAFK